MSKTSELKAERASRKAKRLEERARRAAELALSLEEASKALKPPPEIGSWGVVRTRCWAAIHKKLSRHVAVKRPSSNRLRYLSKLILEVDRKTPEECHRIEQELEGRA